MGLDWGTALQNLAVNSLTQQSPYAALGATVGQYLKGNFSSPNTFGGDPAAQAKAYANKPDSAANTFGSIVGMDTISASNLGKGMLPASLRQPNLDYFGGNAQGSPDTLMALLRQKNLNR